MAFLDWTVVVSFLLTVVLIGLYYTRKSSNTMEDYFISGRNLPWWLAGTSILAMSFSSDTPLHVTRVIREGGLSNAWFYWNGIFSGLLATFFFSRLWRRSGIVTDAEFIELRYAGKPAAVLRFTTAFFRSIVLELITTAWVILGMSKVINTIIVLPPSFAILGFTVSSNVAIVVVLVFIALLYSTMAGLSAVVVADFIEFIVAMGGAILLAILAVSRVGGIGALREQISQSSLGPQALHVLPSAETTQIPTIAILVYLGVQWWSHVEIDGSGKRAQRFLSCRDETHALVSGIWNMAVQWILRNWPWYIAALASLILYPHVSDHETVYPQMIADIMPIGLKGLMVASFFAAFLSTVDSQLNLSASYLVNDLYKRFFARSREPHHYLTVSRITVVTLACVATVLALSLPSVLGAFRFKMELMAGLGLVYILRWFWWRITAWSEIAALITGPTVALALNLTGAFSDLPNTAAFAWRLLTIVGCSTAAALTATFLSPKEPLAHLRAFYERIRPPSLFWKEAIETTLPSESMRTTLTHYLLAVVAVFGGMFSIGKLLLAETFTGFALLAIAIAASWWLVRRLVRPATRPV